MMNPDKARRDMNSVMEIVRNLGILLGAVAAIFGLRTYFVAWRNSRREATLDVFDRVREYVRTDQSRLSSLALSGVPGKWRADAVPMLTRPGWIPPRPIPLEHV